MRALIIGGAGFVGSHLAEALLRWGTEVAITYHLSTGSIDNFEHLKGLKNFSYTIDPPSIGRIWPSTGPT